MSHVGKILSSSLSLFFSLLSSFSSLPPLLPPSSSSPSLPLLSAQLPQSSLTPRGGKTAADHPPVVLLPRSHLGRGRPASVSGGLSPQASGRPAHGHVPPHADQLGKQDDGQPQPGARAGQQGVRSLMRNVGDDQSVGGSLERGGMLPCSRWAEETTGEAERKSCGENRAANFE